MNLSVDPIIWRTLTRHSLKPWSEKAVDVDVKAIRALAKEGIKETPGQVARRWGWPIAETLERLNRPDKPKAKAKAKPRAKAKKK